MWPLVALAVLVMLRGPIGTLLTTLGGRITKLSLMTVEIELATAKEIVPPWHSSDDQRDLRRLVAANDVTDSYFMTLREALLAPGAADYFVVDLHDHHDDKWLTTRLYLFSYILERLKGVRAVVFVGTRGDIGRTYLATTPVTDLLGVLETAHPHLLRARWAMDAFVAPHQLATSPPAPSDPDLAPAPIEISVGWSTLQSRYLDHMNAASTFLRHVQWSPPTPADPPPAGWLRFEDANTKMVVWERATWIRASDLTDGVLQHAALPHEAVVLEPTWKPDERVCAAGELVAVVRPSGRFDRLVDRSDLLCALATRALE
jgi:hypothetical protein